MLFILLLFMLYSCRTTKYVPEERYLLEDYKIEEDVRNLDKRNINNLVRPQPNKKILGMKFHLGMYSLSKQEKEKGISKWLRQIGEPPVLYDEFQIKKTQEQIELYLANMGYYNAEVSDTVIFKKKKATVHLDIKSNEPYRIRRVNYEFEDTTLRPLVLKDTVNSLLKRGKVLAIQILQDERGRIEAFLRNQGYYDFSKEDVFYRVDSSLSNWQADLYLRIRENTRNLEDGRIVREPHRKFRIRRVIMITDYSPREALEDIETYQASLDSFMVGNIIFKYHDELDIKPGILAQSNYIFPGEYYNLSDVRQTHQHLTSLRVFRLVNLEFSEHFNDGPELQEEYELDCIIQLTPFVFQSFSAELEGTNSSGNLGVAGNLNYQHRNFFNGAENFSYSIKGALETLKESYGDRYGNMIEFGTEARLQFPKFLLPLKTEQFIKKYSPKTRISLSYNYQRRPDYTRSIVNTSFGYNWQQNKKITHMVNPIEVNFVKLPYSTPSFEARRDSIQYLFYSYQDHLVTVTNYSFIFSNQDINKPNQNFIYLRINAESAGNILAAYSNLTDRPKVDNTFRLFDIEFSQYLKADIDLRYYRIINSYNSVVYRIFTGIGYPYGNSRTLPFEKQFFSGGANGIRAWQVRNLGPGSYREPERTGYPNQTGDVKLEANLEYRFKLFWVLEGALFADAGNIWSMNSFDEREGAFFEPENFYKDIAVGTGFGTRFDFSFFVFRLDLGMKVRDPAYQGDSKWIIGQRPLTWDDFTMHLAIGYPF